MIMTSEATAMQKKTRNIFGKQFVIKPRPVRQDLPGEKQIIETHFKMRSVTFKGKLSTELEGQDYDTGQ